MNDAPSWSPRLEALYFVGLGGVAAAYVLLNPFRGFVIVNVPSRYAAIFNQ